MNIPHKQLSVDINRRNQYTVDFIGHVNDKDVRYIDVTFNAGGTPITLEVGCTATVTYVSEGVLIDQAAECTVSGSTVVIGVDSEKVENLRSGILEVQPKVIDPNGRVLTMQIPILVRISPDIAEHGQVDDDSLGSYAEVVREIAAARGSYTNLKDRLDHSVAEMDDLSSGNIPNGTNPVSSGNLKTYLEGNYQDYLKARFTKRIYAHETHSSGYDADTNPVDTYSDGGVYIDGALDPSTIYIIKNANGAHIGTLLCAHANGYNRTTQIALYADGRFQYRYRHNTSGVWDEWENIARDSTVFDAVVRNYKDVAADITFNIHNTKVDEFLQTAAYDSSDYSYSNLPTADGTNWDRPNTMTIDIPSGSSKFILYDTITKTERIEPTSGTTHTIDNLIPNRNYAYTVRKSDGSLLSHGIIKAIGQVRMINAGGDDAEVDRTFNIRDLGGWTATGGKLKYGLVYRGGELNGSISISSAQQAFFKDVLGIRHDIDLRDSGEPGVGATALGCGVNYYHLATGRSPYILGDNDTYAKKRADVIKQLAKNIKNGEPTYIHCQAGADRTGVMCVFLKAICGVSQSDIDRDQELSYYSYQADAQRARKRNNAWANGHRVMINGTGAEGYSQPYINNMEGSSFQDKIIRLLLRSGVTIDELNDIRFGLIDGNPTALTNPYGNATITKNLSHVFIDNKDTSVKLYQPFEVSFAVEDFYGLSIDHLTITMGGTNAKSYYSNGKLSIPRVTGNIYISAEATLQTGVISEDMLADGSVSTNKIGSKSVTADKLADYAVDTTNINNSAITSDKINNGAVTPAKLSFSATGYVNANNINDCIENGILYRVYYNGAYQMVICSAGTYIRAQYMLMQGGGVQYRTSNKSGGVWNDWNDDWTVLISGEKVTSISSSATNNQIPSALAVKKYVDTVIRAIYGTVTVSKNLTHISINNTDSSTVMYQPYTAVLSADRGYSINEVSVTVIMGGLDITADCYSNGIISIPKVTEAISITAIGIYVNQITQAKDTIGGTALYNGTGYKQDYRWISDNTEDNVNTPGVPNKFAVGYIELEPGDVVHFYGDILKGISGSLFMHIQSSSNTRLVRATLSNWTNYTNRPDIMATMTDIDYDTTTNTLHSFKWTGGTNAVKGYMHLTCVGTFTEGVTVVTINAEM